MVIGVTLKYFGVISEMTGRASEEFTFQDKCSVNDILATCHSKYPELENTSFQVALNQKIVSEGSVVDRDELALLPPFSGG